MDISEKKLRSGEKPLRPALALAALAAIALSGCEPSPASRALQDKPDMPLIGPAVAPVKQDEASSPAPLLQPASQPAPETTPKPPPTEPVDESGPVVVAEQPALFAESGPAETAESGALKLLGETIPPGASVRLTWSASDSFESLSASTPVLAVNGNGAGPTMCLTAAIHGDELNGIEMVRRVIHDLDPAKLNGAVIGIPIVNLQGFRRGSRYLPDRRDLNRYFPGNAEGSAAARIAHSLFQEIIVGCDTLIDLHTGSFYRTNLPQLRADLRYAEIRELTEGFGGMVVLHSESAPGTLRRAAVDAGIPAVTLEAGEPLRLQSDKVSQGVTGIFTLLSSMGMLERVQLLAAPEPVFYESTWVRANDGGILFSVVRLGQVVDQGDVLGTVTDPISNEQNLIYAPESGRVLGMAVNQVVMPGFAAFRIGLETDAPAESELVAILGQPALPGSAISGGEPLPAKKAADADMDAIDEASE